MTHKPTQRNMQIARLAYVFLLVMAPSSAFRAPVLPGSLGRACGRGRGAIVMCEERSRREMLVAALSSSVTILSAGLAPAQAVEVSASLPPTNKMPSLFMNAGTTRSPFAFQNRVICQLTAQPTHTASQLWEV